MPVRKSSTGQFKGKVALEAVKAEKTLSEFASDYEVHPQQIQQGKRQLTERVDELFADKRRKQDTDREALIEALYKQIGQLKVALDWVKKNAAPFSGYAAGPRRPYASGIQCQSAGCLTGHLPFFGVLDAVSVSKRYSNNEAVR